MAILECYPGLEVTVEVDGAAANEYDEPADCSESKLRHKDFHLADPDRPLPLAVKYIEAKPGSPFQFRIRVTKPLKHVDDDVFFRVHVDGKKDHSLVSYSDSEYQGDWSSIIKVLRSHKDGVKQKHYFRFSSLNIVKSSTLDNKDLETQLKQAEKLGVLTLLCFHGKLARYGTATEATVPSYAGKASETALKGTSVDCLTKFNPEVVPFPRKNVAIHLCADTENRPFAVFKFRYRSMSLIDEGIVPRPSTPTPTPEEIVRGMGEDEVRRLACELLAAERERAKIPSIKEENKLRIKREIELTTTAGPSAKYKSRRRAGGRVEVDLTGDE